jgi:hypothetical protein
MQAGHAGKAANNISFSTYLYDVMVCKWFINNKALKEGFVTERDFT